MELGYERAEEAQAIQAVIERATEDLRRVYRSRRTQTGGEESGVQRLVARLDGRVVGVVGYRLTSGELYIQGLAVHPANRRCGVARALLAALEPIAQREGRSRLTLATIRETGNVRIFERLGFAVVHECEAEGFEAVDGAPVSRVDMAKRVCGKGWP